MIPPDQLAAVDAGVEAADALAKAGDVPAGLERLLQGLTAALDAQQAGAPWGQELADCWRQAVEDYRRQYPLPPA